MPGWDVLTFDCYGTLVDWEGGIAAALSGRARRDGVELDVPEVLRAYAEVEPRVQRERFRPYRDVLARAAVEVGRRMGWALDLGEAAFLAESLASWPLFRDTNPALQRFAAAGIELGILSNVDNDLIAGTVRQFAVPFGFMVTAEDVGSYKPAPGHFEAAARRIRGRRWLHVAQSWFHDVEPAVALGIPVAWVNRRGEAEGGSARPVTVVPDLGVLGDWLGLPSPSAR